MSLLGFGPIADAPIAAENLPIFVLAGNAETPLGWVRTRQSAYLVAEISASACIWTPKPCVAITATLNPSDKNANIALSDDNLMGTSTAGGNNFYNARGTTSHDLGKWYFEGRVHAIASGDAGDNAVGVANATASLGGATNNWFGFDTNSVVVFVGSGATASVWFKGVSQLTLDGQNAAESIIRIALDASARRIWFQMQGGNWNGNAGFDPATGVGGLDISLLQGTIFPGIVVRNTGSACIINPGSFNYAIPSGYQSWEGTDETTFFDKWGYAWTDPPKFLAKRRTSEYPAFTYGAPPIVKTADMWAQPWSLPQRLTKQRTAEYPSFVYGAVPITGEQIFADKWFAHLSNPQKLRKDRTAEFPAVAYGALPIVNTADQWAPPWSNPSVLFKRRCAEFPAFTYGALPIVNTPDQWWQNFSVPQKLRKDRVTEFPAFTYGTNVTVNPDAYWQNLSTPPKAKPRTVEYLAFTYGALPIVQTADEWEWVPSWSLPQKLYKDRTAEYPAFTYGALPIVNTADQWTQPWSTPRSLVAPRRTAEYKDFFPGFPSFEPIFADKWFAHLSNPQKLLKDRAAEFPAFTYGAAPIVKTPDMWWHNLSVPPKYLQKRRTVEYPPWTMGTPPIFNFYPDKYWQNLAVPPHLYVKRRTAEYPAFTYGAVPIATYPDKYWQNLATPPKAKVSLDVRDQQFLAWRLELVGETISQDKWWRDFTQPKRYLFGLPYQYQMPYTANILPIPPKFYAFGYVIC